MNDLHIANRLLPLPALRAYQRVHWRLTRQRLSNLRARLTEIISQPAKFTLIFPPSLDWTGQLWQRPQHMASALAKCGCRVLFFQHQEHWEQEPFREVQPGLFLCSVPVEVFWELPPSSFCVYAMTWNCRSAIAPNAENLIYDWVDELSVFPGSQARLASDHAEMLKLAGIVLVTARQLLDKTKISRPEALLCPNGVDYEHFAQARQAQLQAPGDLAMLVQDKPIAGYIGALARWLDYSLLEELAQKRPDWQFVLVGPDHDRTLPASLLKLPNMLWLGAKSYAELPAYLKAFTAALIPFHLNQVTHAVSPLKLFEYMAAGKPVISTPILEATHIPGVLLANNADEFSAHLDQAILLKQDAAYLEQSDLIARQNTWEQRAQVVMDALYRAHA